MSSPIAIIATITSIPEHRHAVEACLTTAAAATLDEPGCDQYALHRDPGDANRFVMIERWKDQASLDLHTTAPAYKALAASLRGKATLQVVRCVPIS